MSDAGAPGTSASTRLFGQAPSLPTSSPRAGPALVSPCTRKTQQTNTKLSKQVDLAMLLAAYIVGERGGCVCARIGDAPRHRRHRGPTGRPPHVRRCFVHLHHGHPHAAAAFVRQVIFSTVYCVNERVSGSLGAADGAKHASHGHRRELRHCTCYAAWPAHAPQPHQYHDRVMIFCFAQELRAAAASAR